MAELEQQPQPQRRISVTGILKNVGYIALFTLIALVIALAVMFTTNSGSKMLLDRVLDAQNIVTYEYKDGNLYSGIELTEVKVNLKSVDVIVTDPKIKLGWRAILSKQVHLRSANVNHVIVQLKGPPSKDPFSYPKVALPFDLRVDDLYAGELDIITSSGTTAAFNNIELKKVLWQGTHLGFEEAFTSMGYLSIREAAGYIDFKNKYDMKLDGILNISLLHSADIHDIEFQAEGDLEDLKAQLNTQTHNLNVEDSPVGTIKGFMTASIMGPRVPMAAQLEVVDYTLPFLPEQAPLMQQGFIHLKGDIDRLNIGLVGALNTKDLPQAKYTASMHTDYVDGLSIKSLHTDLMGGKSSFSGYLGWDSDLTWNVSGKLNGLNLDHPKLPKEIFDFLPENLNAKVASKGSWSDALKANVDVDFDEGETWSLVASQKSVENASPIDLNIRWKEFNRAVPYIGWLNSPSGQVQFKLQEQLSDFNVNARVKYDELGVLPQGDYRAVVQYKNDTVFVNDFRLEEQQGVVTGKAQVLLANAKRRMTWQADLKSSHFNLAQAVPGAPVVDLNGTVNLKGSSKPQPSQPDQQVIHIQRVDLNGKILDRNERVALNGNGAVTLNFYPEQQGGTFKSFGLDYSGNFDLANSSVDQKNSNLKMNIGGTPEHITVKEFDYKSSSIGRANVKGNIYLGDVLSWKLNADLKDIKPEFFYQPLSGLVTGKLNTSGHWSNSKREVLIHVPENIQGRLQGEDFSIAGRLNLVFDPKKQQFVPKHIEAKNFVIEYGLNKVNVTGNQTDLDAKIDIQKLDQLQKLGFMPEGLEGRVVGDVQLKLGQNIGISTQNLIVQNLKFGKDFEIKKANLQGNIPVTANAPAKLNALISHLKFGNFEFEKIYAQLMGTRAQHRFILHVQDQPRRADFQVLLQGGLNQKQVWSGYVQKAIFRLRNMQLAHQVKAGGNPAQGTALQYDFNQGQLRADPHQWFYTGSLRQNIASGIEVKSPLIYGPSQTQIHVGFNDFDVRPLSMLIPFNLLLDGKLDGEIHVSKQNTRPWMINKGYIVSDLVKLQLYDDRRRTRPSSDPALNFESLRLQLKPSSFNMLDLQLSSQVFLADQAKQKGLVDVQLKFDPFRLAPSAPNTSSPLSGAVQVVKIPLSIAKLFVADVKKLEGTASFKGGITGTVASPLFRDGELVVKDAQIEMASLPINLQDVDIYAAVNQKTARVSSSFKSRFVENSDLERLPAQYKGSTAGSGTLNALVKWDKQLDIQMVMKGESLAVNGAPLFKAVVSPNISMNIQPKQQKVVMRGDVYIPWAQVSMPESTADVIRVSPDAKLRRSSILEASRPWSIVATLDVYLAKQRGSQQDTQHVIFKAFNNDIPLKGQLRITQDKDTRANGRIELNRNRAEVQASVLGQDMTIKQAILDFSGPLNNPALDIAVSKKIQGSEVGINISRTLANPRIAFVSDTGLTEQEALNAILTGRIQDGSSSSTQTDRFKNDMNNSLAAAGLSLGLGGTRQFTNQLGKSLGLSGLALDAQGTADDAQVSITGYLSPELYIRYGIGVFTPVNKLTLRYQASSRLYVEASQSIERALDVFYNWKY